MSHGMKNLFGANCYDSGEMETMFCAREGVSDGMGDDACP